VFLSETVVDKNCPSADWVEAMSRRFTVEREVDNTLRRKLCLRAGNPYLPQSLAALVEGSRQLIAAHHSGEFTITHAAWLTGGASKLQMLFTLHWTPDGDSARADKMVLRMDPAAAVTETSRLREFQLLQVLRAHVPVPEPYWVDPRGDYLPYPALIYGFAEGVTKPASSLSNVTGLGTNLGPEYRAALARPFIEYLAIIHRHDIHDTGLSAFEIPAGAHQAALWAVNWWQRVWEEDCHQELPLMRLASSWMRTNLPRCEQLSIVHCDFRTGNFLFDEKTATITAWLDWELGHIGDRHEDLAWSLSRAFGHYAEDGKTFLSCGLLPEAEFIARYQQVSGLDVDMQTLHFYRILSAYKAIAIVLGAGYRNACNGKSHQDVLLVWLTGLASPLLDELAQLLNEVI
jgi:aminoglycoside phosphotransferase (APT) family kinase protein